MKKTFIILSIILSFTLVSCWANKVEVNTWTNNENAKVESKDISNNASETKSSGKWYQWTKHSRADCMKWCDMAFWTKDKKYDCDWLCDSQVWIENDDISYCVKIKDTLFNATCYSTIAENNNDSSICAKIKDWLYLNTCYMTIAKKTKDAKLCDFVSDTFKPVCLDDLKSN